MMHSADDVYTEYTDPRRDEWQTKILPVLKRMPLAELEKSGLSRRASIGPVRGADQAASEESGNTSTGYNRDTVYVSRLNRRSSSRKFIAISV